METTHPESTKSYNQLRSWFEISLTSLVALEASLVIMWYSALAEPDSSIAVVAIILGIIIFFSHYLTRAMNNLNLQMKLRYTILAIWICLCLYFSLRFLQYSGSDKSFFEMISGAISSITDSGKGMRGFWHLLIVMLSVWRGTALASKPINSQRVRDRITTGIVVLIPYTLVYADKQPNESILAIAGFLFFGLFALSTIRIATLSESRGGKIPRIAPGRILGITLGTTIIIVTALATGWIMSSTVASFILQSALALFFLVTALIALLLIPVTALLFWFFTNFLTPDSLALDLNEASDFGSLGEEAAKLGEDFYEITHTIQKIGRPLLLGGILVGIVFLVVLSLQWQAWRRRKINLEIDSESTGVPRLRLISRFFRERRKGKSPPGFRQLLAAARISKVYFHLMSLCDELNNPRPAAVTTLEFLPELENLFPQDREALHLVTKAFVRIRYGEFPETQEEVREVLSAWKQIRSKRAALIHELKKK